MAIYRIDFPATLPSGETALFGFHADAGTATDADAAASADAWLNAFMSGATPAKPLWPTTLTIGPCKVSRLDASGNVVSAAFGGASVAGTGSASTNQLPPQCSVVVTLRSALSGGSHRGRFYLPPMSTASVNSTGRFEATAKTTLVGALGNAFLAYDATSPSPQVVVWSRKNLNAVNVTRYEVGDVVDTQRRRRDKLTEIRAGGLV